jgi:hypothetical protein
MGCDRVEEVQSIDEYDVPFKSDIAQRIYTYVRQPGGDTIVHKYVYADFVRNRYSQIIKVNSVTTAERIYEVKNKRKILVAEYEHRPMDDFYGPGEKIKGDILQYEEFDLGHQRFKGLMTKITFASSDGFVKTLIEKDTGISDTVQLWLGEDIKALQVHYDLTITEGIKYVPFFKRTYEYTGRAFYAEGLGLVRWYSNFNDEQYETKLVSIKNLDR